MCHHATREAHSLPANCSNSKARLSQNVSISTFSPVSAAEFVELLDCCISDLFANFAHLAAIISSSFLVNSRRFMAMESLAKPNGTGSKCRLRTYLIPQSYHSQPSQTRYLAGSAMASTFSSKLAIAFVSFDGESGTSDGSNLLSSTKRCQGGGRGCGDRNASSSSCSTPKSSQSQLGALAMPGNRTVGWNQHHPACEVVIQLNIRCWS